MSKDNISQITTFKSNNGVHISFFYFKTVLLKKIYSFLRLIVFPEFLLYLFEILYHKTYISKIISPFPMPWPILDHARILLDLSLQPILKKLYEQNQNWPAEQKQTDSLYTSIFHS
jgi:hypothetical protein